MKTFTLFAIALLAIALGIDAWKRHRETFLLTVGTGLLGILLLAFVDWY